MNGPSLPLAPLVTRLPSPNQAIEIWFEQAQFSEKFQVLNHVSSSSTMVLLERLSTKDCVEYTLNDFRWRMIILGKDCFCSGWVEIGRSQDLVNKNSSDNSRVLSTNSASDQSQNDSTKRNRIRDCNLSRSRSRSRSYSRSRGNGQSRDRIITRSCSPSHKRQNATSTQHTSLSVHSGERKKHSRPSRSVSPGKKDDRLGTGGMVLRSQMSKSRSKNRVTFKSDRTEGRGKSLSLRISSGRVAKNTGRKKMRNRKN